MEEERIDLPVEKKESHTIAIQTFSEGVKVIEADQLRVCVPTKECLQFWVHTAACIAAFIVGVVFMGIYDSATTKFAVGQGLLALAVGVLIPSPNYSDLLPSTKKLPTRSARTSHAN